MASTYVVPGAVLCTPRSACDSRGPPLTVRSHLLILQMSIRALAAASSLPEATQLARGTTGI